MSLEELIQRQKHGKVITRKIPLSQEIKKSIYLLVCTLLTIIVLLSIVFLLNRSQETQKGYILTKEEINKEEFLLKRRELIDKIIQAQTSTNIENNDIVKKMQKPDKTIYVKPKK